MSAQFRKDYVQGIVFTLQDIQFMQGVFQFLFYYFVHVLFIRFRFLKVKGLLKKHSGDCQ